MKITKVMIDVDKGKLKVCVQGEEVSFDVFEAMKHPADTKECYRLDVLDKIYTKHKRSIFSTEPLLHVLLNCKEDGDYREKDKTTQTPKAELKQLPTYL